MSVSIQPLKKDSKTATFMTNMQWHKMIESTPEVKNWNGYHDRIVYSPSQLRAIAKANPEESEWLTELADHWGGAFLA